MRSRPALWGLAASCLVLAACGTRLPDTAFVQAQQQAAGGPAATGPSGAPLPGASTGPGGKVVGGGGTVPGGVGPSSSPSGGTGPGGGSGNASGGSGNTASDTGVTATTIT